MQYHVGDKVRIKDTCRIDSLRAGDIVTIDWVGVDLNNIVLYTTSITMWPWPIKTVNGG